jgi:hypothetical protein
LYSIVKLAHDSSGASNDPYVKKLVKLSLPDCHETKKPEEPDQKPSEEKKEEANKPK